VQDKQQMVIVEIVGRPSCLELSFGTGGENGNEVLYGAQDGSLGLVSFGL